MLRLNHVRKVFEEKKIGTVVLEDVSLAVKPGEFLGIVGRSGCGKSTLLNIIALLEPITSGEYYFDGEDVSLLKDKELSLLRNKSFGYIFQSFHLINDINVLDNVSMPLGYAGVGKKERLERATILLEKVDMLHRAKYYPSELSGGEKQRVAIARALINNPRLLLADEPTGSLDIKNAHEIMDLLVKLNSNGTTIVMVTHDQSLIRYMTRVIEMYDGNLSL